MNQAVASSLEEFRWAPQPQAEGWVRRAVDEFLDRNTFAAELSRRMADQTGTRFVDWVDHLVMPAAAHVGPDLSAAGFVAEIDERGDASWRHPGGVFPIVRLAADGGRELAIRVESVADFAAANGLPLDVDAPPLSLYRRLLASLENETTFRVVERHGFFGLRSARTDDSQRLAMLRCLEAFRTRRRLFDDESDGFTYTLTLVDGAIRALGQAVACDLFFADEREYWQRRNRAAQVQKARQDVLGLGWANHDHHTYRSSREHFVSLMALFEKMGFVCRERFYAGAEAGWGAQVLEHPEAGVVIFADVDLSPDELLADFAHEPLPARHELGTVGLWCALHGEAILEAGMHHLECRFDFESLRRQLEEGGVKTMKPFTDLPYLRQAFTEGERWPVREERIARLLARGQITGDQAEQFRRHGAIGSHLENLQRDQGFKGFNQQGVNDIIRATDPRNLRG